MISDNKIGYLVKVYMKNGIVFNGAVRVWNENKVILASPLGEIIDIYDVNEICAVVYMEKNAKIIKERQPETIDEEPKHEVGDIPSLIELYKMKAQSERDVAKIKLKSPTCTAGDIEYGSILSVLPGIKNNT